MPRLPASPKPPQPAKAGPYSLQAAISAVHAEAADAASTDWPQIVALYDILMHLEPSPIVELTRAAAVAMRDGPEAGLALVDAILSRGELADYHLAHSRESRPQPHASSRRRRPSWICGLQTRAIARLTDTVRPSGRFIEKRLADLRQV